MQEYGRLGYFGLFELLVGTTEHNVGYGETENVICFIEEGFGFGHSVVE
jgi:hypothetical protein